MKNLAYKNVLNKTENAYDLHSVRNPGSEHEKNQAHPISALVPDCIFYTLACQWGLLPAGNHAVYLLDDESSE